ncbi:apolipoprotein N-acyltransferase [Sphingopyxis chilensis]|uniref:apolipoprotein N-acyltransferase n=1 Tax=Sphingopyxis chilensis TaxID=180400 RepID=UPI002DDD5C64|nr:apolipoprotein N-acyltransferase [Sphingopyxis chilensis]
MTLPSLRIAAFADRWPKFLALLLGAISATGFAPLHLWPLTLLALAGWMALVARSPRGWRAAGIGWAFGVGHFAIGLNWIATAFTYQAAMPAWLGWIAVVLLSLYLAVYPALAAWGAWMMKPRGETHFAAPSYLLAFGGLWTLAEWLRSWIFTGFAWNPLGVIAVPHAAMPARWIGTYGMSGIVFLLAGVLILAWFRRRVAAAALFGSVLAFWGAACLSQMAGNADAAVRSKGIARTPITVVQPNVGQEDKWEGSKAAANFAKLARLTTPKDDTPRLILWPEAAVPDYLERGYPAAYYDRSPAEARRRIVALMNAGDVMLLGALKLELDKAGDVVGARNAVMTVHADGTLGPRYDKAHLVPYGEYLPMRPILSAIGLSRLAPGDIDFWPGPGPHTLDLGAFGRAGLQICYEIIFSGQVVDRDHRPDFIFNPSNDAWFGSWGPPQHLAQARLRAIEEGLPVIRATPTGISAVIDADGRIVDALPMHRAGRIDTTVPSAQPPTLFARFGNILSVGFALLLLALAIAFRRSGR